MRVRLLAALLCVSAAVLVLWRLTPRPEYPRADTLLRRALLAEQHVCCEADLVIGTMTDGGWREARAKMYKSGRKSRLEYGRGGAVVVSGCHGEMCTYEPRDKVFTFCEPCGLVNCARRLELVLSNYRPSVIGQDVVAGRRAYVLSLIPKRGRSVGARRTIWVDELTGLILRSSDRGSDRKLHSEFTIQKVTMRSSLPDELFRPPNITGGTACVRLERCATLSQARRTLGLAVAKPGHTPAGFEPEGIRLCKCGCGCGFESLMVRYTDGLQSISVYQDQVGKECKRCGGFGDPPSDGGCRVMRAGNDLVALRKVGNRRIAVVGDMRPAEMRRIAESIP